MSEENRDGLTRRNFLTRMAWLLAGVNMLPLISPASLFAGEKSQVGLIKSSNRREAVRRALKLLPPPDVNGKRVLIKPNFNTADPAPGSTHNDTLETVIDELWERGADEVIIGERSGPPVTEEVMREKCIFEMAEKKGVEVVNFDLLKEDELTHFQDDRLHWRDGFHVPRILNEVDHIIACACLKTHQFGGRFTMALKLAVGIIPAEGTAYMNEMHRSPHMREKIAEINLAYSPDLYIVDGVEAFTSGGPSSGKRVQADITLVSRDPVAVDAVGVAALKELGSTDEIMEPPIFKQEQIARAIELDLGISGPEAIRLVADDKEGKEYAATIGRILAEG